MHPDHGPDLISSIVDELELPGNLHLTPAELDGGPLDSCERLPERLLFQPNLQLNMGMKFLNFLEKEAEKEGSRRMQTLA